MTTATTDTAGGAAVAHEFHIVVNARGRTVSTQVLTYEAVVALAFPGGPTGDDVLYTVTYKHADQRPADGALVAGQQVTIQNGTQFDVDKTNRS